MIATAARRPSAAGAIPPGGCPEQQCDNLPFKFSLPGERFITDGKVYAVLDRENSKMTRAGRFLIASWDGGGNVPPALNLGARLVHLGHRVRVLGWESMKSRADTVGLEFTVYPSVPPWPSGVTLQQGWKEHVIPALYGPGTRDDIRTEIEDFGPDVVVVDCMIGVGLEVADTLDLPRAVLIHVLYSTFTDKWGTRPTRAKNAAYLDRSGQVLVLVPPDFDIAYGFPPNTSNVGPITNPNPGPPLSTGMTELLAEPGKPWVLLSLGTTLQDQAKALPGIFEAVARLPIRVLLTLGGVVLPSAINPPPNVTVCGFIPHELLMPHMAAVVSHGGLSTITSALTAGVPLVCIPESRDQPDNAKRVVASGVGRAVDKDARPAEIAAAIEGVLTDPAVLEKTNHFANIIAALGRGDVAARKVAGLVGPNIPGDY
jgi:UDP-glucoronosyl and UDP-glucosyl transferase